MIVSAAVLRWERAEDLKRALAVRVIGYHVDTTGLGPRSPRSGAAGARADPEHFVIFCRMTEADRDRAP
jgi:hypothetical protein